MIVFRAGGEKTAHLFRDPMEFAGGSFSGKIVNTFKDYNYF